MREASSWMREGGIDEGGGPNEREVEVEARLFWLRGGLGLG